MHGQKRLFVGYRKPPPLVKRGFLIRVQLKALKFIITREMIQFKTYEVLMNYLCLSLSGTSTGCLLCTYSGMPKHFLSTLEKRFVLPYRCTPQLLGYMDATFRVRWTIPTLQHLLQRNGVYPKPTRKTPCFRALFRFLKQRESEITIMLNIFENYIDNVQGLEIIIDWIFLNIFCFIL